MKIALIGSGSALGKNIIDISKNNPQLEILGFQRSKRKDTANTKFYPILRGVPKNPEVLNDIDAVVYLIGTNQGSDKEIEQINVEFLKNYLKVHPKGCPLIYLSSVSVTTQESTYAHSKKVCENKIREQENPYMILRPSLLYGDYDRGNLYSLQNKLKWLPIIPSPPVEHQIQPVHMKDLSEFIILLVQNGNYENKEIVVSNPNPISSYEVIKKICENFSTPRIVIPMPLKMIRILIKLVTFIFTNFDLKSQLQNMSSHEPFDSTEALKLGYKPRKFKGL
ncbi:MAG: hypothetical protein EP326_10890 [Deltaproteobacteria bacterium]|nr:MAG: hypothetical protein EP326_10890 [Deltaproteobacteria bacterium]